MSGTTSYILGSDLLKKASTEYGIMAVEDLRNLVEVKGPDILITLVEIQSLIEQADKLCEEEAAL